jgi:hypothetical protein
MSKIVLAILALVTIVASCKDEKRKTSYSGFIAIEKEAAFTMIRAYSDSRVPHGVESIIKSIRLNSKEFSELCEGADSVKLFTAADTVRYMPMIIIQTISTNSPVSYSYYVFEDARGAICPPPNDCQIE